MNIPNDRKYSATHEWVKIENGKAVVGLTDHAQSEMGDIVFINLPEMGFEIGAGEAFSDVESIKAVSDILCPVSGKVTKVNEALLDAPELINQAPYETFIAEISDITAEADGLLTAEQYEKLLGEGA